VRVIGIALALMLVAAAAFAQQSADEKSAPAAKTFASAADIQALITRAKNERKKGQANVPERILQLTPYNVNLDYRASVGPATVHEREAELFYVLDGSATMVIGGKLVDEARTNPTTIKGTAIEGGVPHDIAKGDVIIVPENTPHWFSTIHETLVLMTLHLPPVNANH
jgi:mannose-6-phosphate isomerase-like protein (cupin superfamily)